jgi:hypothetical protein
MGNEERKTGRRPREGRGHGRSERLHLTKSSQASTSLHLDEGNMKLKSKEMYQLIYLERN